MKRRVMAVLGVVVLLSSLLVAASPVAASPPPPDYKDVGPDLRAQEPRRDLIVGPTPADLMAGEEGGEESGASTADQAAVGQVKLWLALDDYCGYYYFKPYQLRAVGEHGEVWVAMELSYTIPPAEEVCVGKPSDPRPAPVISDEQVAYLLNELDSNIYPTDASFFGTPDEHDGTYSLLEAWGYAPPGYYAGDGDKVLIMVDNVRDEQWYDHTYPWFIAGFYSPTFEAYFDRNMISIDAKEWDIRMGPGVQFPYLYEGVIAHEFQHLIHDDLDPDEETFVNEGCSDFAEYLCGYGHPDGHLAGTGGISLFPENSLVVWEDQGDLEILADYGLVYLWTLYLYENFGGAFIQAMASNPEHGIAGINSTLDAFNIQKDFAELFHDFSVAMLIDSSKAGGRYGFEDLEFNLDIGTPGAPNPEAFDTPGAPPWGSDYIWIDGNPKELAKFTFNGIDYTTFPTEWTSDGEVLWSGTGDLLDNWAIFEATGGGTLQFDTIWDLEDYWDYGFVQVSTDGGHTWTSLEDNEGYATFDYDPSAHPTVKNNLPGLTSWIPSWVTLTYDLGAYAGQDILIALRLVTDWATHYGGWWVDNILVDGTLISDGSNASIFKDITEVVPINNDFTVTFVGIKEKARGNEYKVHTMKLDEVTETGLFELNKVLKSADSAVMVVTFDAPPGFTGYADYSYDFTFTNEGPKK